MNRLKKEVLETKVLLRSIPSLTMTLFVVSVVTMNLLANKSISLPISCLALDCGMFFEHGYDHKVLWTESGYAGFYCRSAGEFVDVCDLLYCEAGSWRLVCIVC